MVSLQELILKIILIIRTIPMQEELLLGLMGAFMWQVLEMVKFTASDQMVVPP